MTAPDYATWLTKQQAADAIGVSTKTVEKLAQDRQLEQAVWRRPTGGPPLAVFHPDDVARIAAARRGEATPFVLPAVPARNGNGHGPHTGIQVGSRLDSTLPTPTGEDVLRLVFAAALRALSAEKPATSESSEKLFLTLPEASALSGLSPTYLKRAIVCGSIQAVKDGRRWRIRRKDLEQL